MRNLHDVIAKTEYQNEPIIANLARLSGTTHHAVVTYLIEIALSKWLATDSDEEIAEDIESFYSKD
jgi:hypothetical protein